MPVRAKYIRGLVEKILTTNQIKGPDVPVEKIAKKLGAEIIYEPNDDDLSGFLFRDYTQGQVVIGVNENHSENRRRFTIGHEIGHFLLHEYNGFHFDRTAKGLQFKWRNDESSKGTDIEEKEANLFAAELLMPVIFLERDLAKISEIDLFDSDAKSLGALAKRYAVSVQAMTYRLSYLNIIDLRP